MTGKGHIVSGSIFMTDTLICCAFVQQIDLSVSFHNFFESFNSNFNPLIFYQDYNPVLSYLMLGICIFAYYIGLLLPDIDTTSTISNFLHFQIPGPHRGLTHSVWFVLLFYVLGIFYIRSLVFLSFGMFVHDITDGFSAAGWVPFYPFGKYQIKYENIVCSKCKHITLYTSTAKHSEAVCNLIFILVSALIFAGILLVRYYF